MTWWMIVLCVIGYLVVGIVVSGLVSACFDLNDEIVPAGCAIGWPFVFIICIVLGFYKVSGALSIWTGKWLFGFIKHKTSKKYKEKDTKCDGCTHLEECKREGLLLDITLRMDTRRHYVPTIGCDEGELCKGWIRRRRNYER